MAYRVKIGARLDRDIRRLLSAQTGRAIGYLSGTLEDGGSTIHSTRKCLKRSRSILRLVAPGLTVTEFRQSDRAFRDIARLLSLDRDREVMSETLTLLASKATGDGKAALLAALDELNTPVKSIETPTDLPDNIARAIALLQKRDHAIHRLDIAKVHIENIAEGYAATYAQGRKALKAAYRADTDEAFHTLRKALQHHWRHCQLLAPAWPDLMNVRITAARDISQMIGVDHDLSLVVAHFANDGSSKLDPAVRTRIASAAKAEQKHLRTEVKPLAGRLYAARPSHLQHLILDHWPAAIRLAKSLRKQGSTQQQPPSGDVIPLKARHKG
jgi:hypothetical protein